MIVATGPAGRGGHPWCGSFSGWRADVSGGGGAAGETGGLNRIRGLGVTGLRVHGLLGLRATGTAGCWDYGLRREQDLRAALAGAGEGVRIGEGRRDDRRDGPEVADADRALAGELRVVGEEDHASAALDESALRRHLDGRRVEDPALRVDAARAEEDERGADVAQRVLGER